MYVMSLYNPMLINYNAKTLTENKAVHCLQFTIKRDKNFPCI